MRNIAWLKRVRIVPLLPERGISGVVPHRAPEKTVLIGDAGGALALLDDMRFHLLAAPWRFGDKATHETTWKENDLEFIPSRLGAHLGWS
jgi:hypothetical protein